MNQKKKKKTRIRCYDVAQVQHGVKMLVLHSKAVHTSSEPRGRERAKLTYSDADCGAFVNRVRYTHHPACMGCTVENGRLASRDQYRENSADWDTNDTQRRTFTHAEINSAS